ncbi:MAG TPA: hypothetical protein VFR17_02435 [Mycobacterium sp.]|nr:hypothetical protein [Mycobacterium sp.]
MTDELANDAILTAAAFGSAPETWPLPSATTPGQHWLRAVAAGGQGRFAAARADLAALVHRRPCGRLASLAHSTQGSFLRQLGWHALAREHDGRALALAGQGPEAVEARTDALIGLAADALGVGRFRASAALLATVAGPPAGDTDTLPAHRLGVRRAWVTAELAMATGDGATAVRHAELAAELAPQTRSARHRVKSEVVLAAALCCAGQTDRARAVADQALEDTGRLGLIPLQWALARLLADIGSTSRTAQEIDDIRNRCADLVHQRGGEWRQR